MLSDISRSQIISQGVTASVGGNHCWHGQMVDIPDSVDSDVSRPYLDRVAKDPGPVDNEIRLARIALQDTDPNSLSAPVREGLGNWMSAGNGAAMRAALLTLHGWQPTDLERLMVAGGRAPKAEPGMDALLMGAGKNTWTAAHRSTEQCLSDKIGYAGSIRYLAALQTCDSPLAHSAAAALQIQGSFLGAIAASQALFGSTQLSNGNVKSAGLTQGTAADQTAAGIARTGKQAMCTHVLQQTDFNQKDVMERLNAELAGRLGELGRVFINRVANDDGLMPDYGASSLKDFARTVRGIMGATPDAAAATLISEAALTVLSDPQAVGKTPDQLLALTGLAVYDEKLTPARNTYPPRNAAAQPFLDRLTVSENTLTSGAARLAKEVPLQSRTQPTQAAFRAVLNPSCYY